MEDVKAHYAPYKGTGGFSRDEFVGPPKPSALDIQEGGNHYKDMAIQPVEFIHANNLGFLEGCIIKRICRWRSKDGIKDLLKIKHEVDLLIELEKDEKK